MKNQATMRQINAARETLQARLREIELAWREKNPAPGYEENEQWKREHPSPDRIHRKAETAFMKAFSGTVESLLFDARMGKITADEFYTKVKEF